MIQVLIVNDERAASSLLNRLLTRSDDMICIGNAFDGEEAVRMAQALQPDVVLMDLMMPGMDGIEATERIREFNPEIKIVVNTARGDYAERALKAGASVVLSIPITQDDILGAIRNVVESA